MEKLKRLSNTEKAAIQELKHTILKDHGLIQIKLFGSKVRGDASEYSDIDLLIILEKVNWQIEKAISELCFEIGLKYDLLLSPIIFSLDDINNKLIQSTPFHKILEREGIAV